MDLVHLDVIVHGDPAAGGHRSVEVVAPPALLDPQVCGLPPLDLAALLVDE